MCKMSENKRTKMMENRDKLNSIQQHLSLKQKISEAWIELNSWSSVQPQDLTLLMSLIQELYFDNRTNRAIAIDKLDIKPDEILVVRVGLDNVDEDGPWVPTLEELHHIKNELQSMLGENQKILVYHHGLRFQTIPLDKVESVIGDPVGV